MSSSSKESRGSGLIAASAPLGVGIKILDGDLATVAASTGELHETLPGGIYTVRWTAGNSTEQKVVRLRDGDTLKLEPETLLPGAAASEDEDLAGRQFAQLARLLSAPMAEETELIVFVCANDVRTSSDVGGSVKLRRIDSGPTPETRKVRAAHRHRHIADGWSILRYEPAAGPHILRYVSAERVTLEQTVYVVGGRRTVVWLRYGCAARTELLKKGARVRARRGIEPTKSRIISFGGAVGEAELKSAFLLADVLLHQLTVQSGELDSEVLYGLDSYRDPYLRLFAASVLLTCPLGASKWWSEPRADQAMYVPESNLAAAKSLLAPLFEDDRALEWPDLLCARWRIAMAEGRLDFPKAEVRLPAAPMLESGWRWAAAWTIEKPVVDPANTPGLQAIAVGQERNTPWLTWRAADERRRSAAVPVDTGCDPEEISTSLRAFTEISQRLAQGEALSLAGVSRTTVDLVRAVLRGGGANQWMSARRGLIHQLAGAMGLPVGTLRSALDVGLEELTSVESGSDAATAADLLSSDPNKGRFGGKARKKGLSLSLVDFRSTNNPEFIALDLEVAGSSRHKLEDVVTFHLHPTFNPDFTAVAPVGGKATFTCYAWGAFTVGAETADGVRLELDLAEDERLPRKFRSR